MSSLNKVMLIGNLGDEVKLHHFDNGNCIGRFPIATNSSYTNKQTGEKVSKTEWHNIVVRNKGAEVCEKYLKKGSKVYIEGRIETRKWKDDQQIERWNIEIHASTFTFLDSNPNNESAVDKYQQKPDTLKPEEEHDDLPF